MWTNISVGKVNILSFFLFWTSYRYCAKVLYYQDWLHLFLKIVIFFHITISSWSSTNLLICSSSILQWPKWYASILGWVEPLLDRIAEDKRNVVCPVIDVIEDDSFKYQYGNARSTSIGGFDWNLQFNWHAIPEDERARREYKDYAPVRYYTSYNSHTLLKLHASRWCTDQDLFMKWKSLKYLEQWIFYSLYDTPIRIYSVFLVLRIF